MINTPGNPSGKVWTRAELEAVGRIARERDLYVFTDEVYEHFVFDGRKHLSPAALPGLRERTITMNALSKTFAITGWRIGWLAAPGALAEAFAHLHDLVYVCAPAPLQLGCARGLERLDPEYYAAIGVEYQRKRDQLCAALADAGSRRRCPPGSYFALADVSRLPGATGDERAHGAARARRGRERSRHRLLARRRGPPARRASASARPTPISTRPAGGSETCRVDGFCGTA